MTKLIVVFRNFPNAPNNSHNPSAIHILCSCNPLVCAADSSCFLQSADCDTEWLIGINVVTGGVLCTKGIVRI